MKLSAPVGFRGGESKVNQFSPSIPKIAGLVGKFSNCGVVNRFSYLGLSVSFGYLQYVHRTTGGEATTAGYRLATAVPLDWRGLQDAKWKVVR
jgi:hypothetical protein